MSGTFINTTSAFSQLTNKASEMTKGLLNNPYYLFTDKKPSECTYYNINITMTTVDEATRGNYGEISPNDPVRFNKIKNFLLYGITRIEPNLEINDFGLEGGDVSGDCIILPNTIQPYPGDYFYLTALNKPYLFHVTAVNPNTLDTGATLYRIQYELISSDGLKDPDKQVVKTYIFSLSMGGSTAFNPNSSTGNNGTNLSTSLIDEDLIDQQSIFEATLKTLKDYYISLFYDSKVETFVYKYQNFTSDWYANNGELKAEPVMNMHKGSNPFGFKVYDPYLIEFMIRNRILTGSSDYIHITQQMFLPNTFAYDYSRTIYSLIEDRDIDKHYGYYVGNLLLCNQKQSILYAYPEDYYYMTYKDLNARFFLINIFDDPEFTNKIRSYTLTYHPLKDILIKYFNNKTITKDDLKRLQHMDYLNDKEFFYGIPFAIYCIERQLKEQPIDLSDNYNLSNEIDTSSDNYSQIIQSKIEEAQHNGFSRTEFKKPIQPIRRRELIPTRNDGK